MTQNEFNVVLEQQYRKCADVLVHKKKEYTGDRIDRLSAFKIAASLQGCTPKTALAGMMSKHVVSLYDMFSIMITFGRKLKHLRQKNHLTQKELGIALGFPEDSADVELHNMKQMQESLVMKSLLKWLKYFTYQSMSSPFQYYLKPKRI